MAEGQVQSKYWLDPAQRDFVKDQAAAAGTSASEFIDMLIQLWRQLEAGQVVMKQLPPAAPFQARLDAIRPAPLTAQEINALFGADSPANR